MTTVTEKERRGSRRFTLDWPVCLWHQPTSRFYNARSINISATGALVQLPLSVPIRAGEQVEVNLAVPKGPAAPTQSKVFSASIVRVNRGESILNGRQSVAMRFV